MNAFRPLISSSRPAVASSLRGAVPRHTCSRGYADQAPSKQSSSNLPLILGALGLLGAGGYYFTAGGAPASVAGVTPSAGALDKQNFKEFTLKAIQPYNHDSAIFSFELPDNAKPGMRVASAVLLAGAGEPLKDQDGKDVIRPYTPITSPDTAGKIDFLVKKYEKGNMSKHMHNMKPGDKLGIKGPIDKIEYKPNVWEHIGMIAGGSGITPMWQVIQSIANNPSDKTKVTLIYCNKSEKDILLRERFDELSAKDDRFKVVYGLDKKPKGMPQDAFEGYVTPEHISKYMPAPALAENVKIFVCGPPPQYEAICGGKGPKGSQGELKGLLADLGYAPGQVFKF